MAEDQTILRVTNLKTYFQLDEGLLKAVDGVTFSLSRNRTMALIGESGCGKSVTAQSILRIVPSPGRIVDGSIVLHREPDAPIDIAALSASGSAMRAVRGRHISMIFQEPMTSLSPVHSIGSQIQEAVLLHITRKVSEAKERAIEMIGNVGIPNPHERYDAFPHQLSGGLRQRAMIAMALSCNPGVLVADEPTTALDVTVQAQILELIRNLQTRLGMAVLYITHDLGVVAEVAEDVIVMYLGHQMEVARARDLFHHPLHPYTSMLLRSVPKLGLKARARLEAIPGNVPAPINFPRQCPFISRCPHAMPGVCDQDVPPLFEVEQGHFVRCYLYRGTT